MTRRNVVDILALPAAPPPGSPVVDRCLRFNRLCLAVWAAPCVCAPVFVVRHTLALFVRHPTGKGVTLTLFACHPPVVCVCNLDAVVTLNCVAASAMIRQDEYLSSLGMSFEGASEGGNNGGALSTPLPPFVLFGLVVPPWLPYRRGCCPSFCGTHRKIRRRCSAAQLASLGAVWPVCQRRLAAHSVKYATPVRGVCLIGASTSSSWPLGAVSLFVRSLSRRWVVVCSDNVFPSLVAPSARRRSQRGPGGVVERLFPAAAPRQERPPGPPGRPRVPG